MATTITAQKAKLKGIIQGITYNSEALTCADTYTNNADVYPYCFILKMGTIPEVSETGVIFDVDREYMIKVAFDLTNDDVYTDILTNQLRLDTVEELIKDALLTKANRSPTSGEWYDMKITRIDQPYSDDGVQIIDNQYFLTFNITVTCEELHT